MLRELKFVQGAVATKDLLPAMTHFRIQNGTVRSYDGRMAISSPIALDIDCCPKAAPMVKAILNCNEATTISMTPTGKLSIRSGKFRALIDTIQGETPHVQPAGEPFAFDGEAFLEACKVLEPFIGADASRPWTNGMLFEGQSVYATNNNVLVQYWLNAAFPLRVNVPRKVIKEILRVGEVPTHGQVDQSSITFHYSDGRWIRSQLIELNWPLDLISGLLDQPSNPVPFPEDFFAGLATIKSMADGTSRVYMREGALRTHADTDEEGAVYEMPLPADGLYNLHMLGLLEGVATSIDLTPYPGPALFFGERLRGAIVGMRM
jgi:hypothetical protein